MTRQGISVTAEHHSVKGEARGNNRLTDVSMRRLNVSRLVRLAVAATVVVALGTAVGYATGGEVGEVWNPQAGFVKVGGCCPSSVLLPNGMVRTYFHEFIDRKGRVCIVYTESVSGLDHSRARETNACGTGIKGDLEANVFSPSALILNDGSYLLVYQGQAERGAKERHLFARKSSDGVTFGPSVMLPSSTLDHGLGGSQGLVRQGVADLVQFPDGTIRVYYCASARIASMTSTDGGTTWTQDAGYRLGTGRGPGYFDPDGVVNEDGSVTLYFSYSNSHDFPSCHSNHSLCQRIRMAHSQDGLTFTMVDEDLLAVTGRNLMDPDVYRTADGTWYMVYGEDDNLLAARKVEQSESGANASENDRDGVPDSEDYCPDYRGKPEMDGCSANHACAKLANYGDADKGG